MAPWESAGIDDSIRQGDILCWPDWQRRPPWEQFGLVLTADCDIAWGKSSNFYSYVPLLTIDSYVDKIWGQKKAQSKLEKIIRKITSSLNARSANSGDGPRDFSQGAIVQFLRGDRFFAEKTCAAFFEKPEDKAALLKLYDVGNFYFSSDLKNHEKTNLKICAEFFARCDDQDVSTAFKRLLDQARSDVVAASSEMFFISELPSIEIKGFMAMLRYVRTIPIDEIFTSLSEAKSNGNRAVRLCKLNDNVKYAITQKFGLLFSRIGLPAEYEKHQEAAIDAFCSIANATLAVRTTPNEA